MNEVTQILSDIEQGDPNAAEQLLPLVYDELRKLAAARLAREKPDHTLQATELVHEAYLRLMGPGDRQPSWDNRSHFFAAAAEAMRRILVENARRKNVSSTAAASGASIGKPWIRSAEEPSEDLVALDEALNRLAAEDPAKAELVKLALLRRSHHAGDRPGDEDLAGNRRTLLDLRPHLAIRRAEGP